MQPRQYSVTMLIRRQRRSRHPVRYGRAAAVDYPLALPGGPVSFASDERGVGNIAAYVCRSGAPCLCGAQLAPVEQFARGVGKIRTAWPIFIACLVPVYSRPFSSPHVASKLVTVGQNCAALAPVRRVDAASRYKHRPPVYPSSSKSESTLSSAILTIPATFSPTTQRGRSSLMTRSISGQR